MAGPLVMAFARRFPGGASVEVAARLDLAAAPLTVLFGPSGAGKSTVLRCIAGLERPDDGTIGLGEERWSDAASGRFLPPRARRVGLVAQEGALFPHLTAAENVAYGLFALPAAGRHSRVAELAAATGIAPLLGRKPHQLSGGERQRVALARALAPQPRILLLDEPFSALDAGAREQLRHGLRRMLSVAGVPAILVTHDRAEALALGDRIAVLADGRLRQVGPPEEVFGAPADERVARAVGTENVLPARLLRVEGGLAVVQVGAVQLTGVDPGGLGGELLVCLRAEEVVLEPGSAATSARNRLAGTVEWVRPEGPLARVRLDCGFPLVALVTRRAVEELSLAPGARVFALVKAPAVRLVPRE